MDNVSIPTMLTIKETAKLFKLSEHFLRKGVNDGKIVAIRSGRKVLINAEKLTEYLNSNKISELDLVSEQCNVRASLPVAPIPRKLKADSGRPYVTPIAKK